jgi:hypothetical protein
MSEFGEKIDLFKQLLKEKILFKCFVELNDNLWQFISTFNLKNWFNFGRHRNESLEKKNEIFNNY